jgi:hypothetical protein
MIYIFFKLLFWFYVISDFKCLDELAKCNLIYNFAKTEAVKMQYMEYDETIYTTEILNYIREVYKEFKKSSKEDARYVYIYTENFSDGDVPYYKNLISTREFLNFCDSQMQLGSYEERVWGSVKKETKRLYQIYDLLDDINRPGYCFYRKRQKASELRVLMGDYAFENKIIPFYLPIHLFTRID